MSEDESTSTLGTCPVCDRELSTEWLLARYVTRDEPATLLAGCPACREVVRPVRR